MRPFRGVARASQLSFEGASEASGRSRRPLGSCNRESVGPSGVLQEPLRVRLRESLRVFPVLFQAPVCPIRESVRPSRGVAAAVLFPFEGVLERFSTRVMAIETFTAPVFGALVLSLPPWLRFPKTRKRFCWAKTLDPLTPGRKRAPGLIRRSAERPRSMAQTP